MRGWLIYYKQDAEINRWFINHLIGLGPKYQLDIQPVIIQHPCEIMDRKDCLPDFVMNRTRNEALGKYFEKRNVLCINNSKTIGLANDKWKTYLLCRKLKVPVMETVLCHKSDLNHYDFDYPKIVKTLDGHGGKEIYWADSKKQLLSILDNFRQDTFIIQNAASDTGIDVRAYVVGDKIITSVMRRSEKDFRSNYSLGGEASLFQLGNDQIHYINVLQKYLESDYIGIDFILHNQKWVVNEIEDAVGARMLYSLTDFDICDAFLSRVNYVSSKNKNDAASTCQREHSAGSF